MPINFRNKLTVKRPYQRADHSSPDDYELDLDSLQNQLESDRGRIIQSAAIRRLQQKTQVFPLERNAAVRSRLTHSLEVMQTGRHIIKTIFKKLGPAAQNYGLHGLQPALESLVEMACLLHDVGNPPFGHFGEAALTQWLSRHLGQLGVFAQPYSDAGHQALKQQLIDDLSQFEGNAQALRLTHTLLRLNLTYIQSACILKYTRPAYQARPAADAPFGYLQKKTGYYLSEEAHIQQLQTELQIEPGCRYPLTYIMEAADDIAYCLADIEDGVEKDLMDYPQLAQRLIEDYTHHGHSATAQNILTGGQQRSFDAIVNYALSRADQAHTNKTHEFFLWLRVGLIHPLVEHAADNFITHLDEIYHGRLDRALMEDHSPSHAVIKTFKSIAFQHIFNVSEVETLELQGHHILTQLLQHYRPLLELSHGAFQRLINGQYSGLLIESLLFRRLPDKHISAYREAVQQHQEDDPCVLQLWELYYRCRLITDMLSGMTDQYALDEYRTLSAIN